MKDKASQQFYEAVSEALKNRGFSTHFTEEGELAVRHDKVPGNLKLLCTIGENGVVYCSSSDFKNLFKKKLLEEVLESIYEVAPPTRQQSASPKRSRGNLERG